MMHELVGKAKQTSLLREIVWKLELSLRALESPVCETLSGQGRLNGGKGVIPMSCFIRESKAERSLETSKDEKDEED